MSHDPFPMNSDEARRLAASVQHGGNETAGTADASNSWSTMDTLTTISPPTKDESLGRSIGGDTSRRSLLEPGHSNVRDSNNTGQRKRQVDRYMNKNNLDEDDDSDVDDFLDIPLDDAKSKWKKGLFGKVARFISESSKKLYHRFYSDELPPSEMRRTLCLSATLFFMIGGYWLLRSVKDPVLTALCGVTVIPKAKMLSVVVVLVVVSVYNHLLDSPNVTKHSLFYIFGSFYFFTFATISYFLRHPTIGLANQTPDSSRILGWVSYCAIESFGSVMVSLFWSFTNSNFSYKSAKASYGLLTATAQLGSILGPTIVNQYVTVWGVPTCYFIGALCMLFLQASMYIYILIYGTEETKAVLVEDGVHSNSPKQTKTSQPKGAGILEGLHLFVQYNYVKGIFAISCLFMVEVTIIDYTLKVLARDHFASLFPCNEGSSCWSSTQDEPMGMSLGATEAFTKFMGLFGLSTNILSFLLSFFGTSIVIRKLGLQLTLLLFPCLCLIVIIMVRLRPTLNVVFAAMMILKASTYAFNNPTKEILYQPTSSAVKYKSKSWIDTFGARGSKALGSVVTNAFSDSTTSLIHNGSFVGMLVASYLIWNSHYMGVKFDEYMKAGTVVGGSESMDDRSKESILVSPSKENDASPNLGLELATWQNDGVDTSCAMCDDDDDVSDNKVENKLVESKIEFV